MKQILKSSELKKLRQSRGVSQSRLARDLGIQRSYISQFENGKYLFDDDTLLSLKRYLDTLDKLNDDTLSVIDDLAFDARVRDGILVPGGLDVNEVENGFELLHQALDAFDCVCDLDLPVGFFGSDEEELRNRHLEAGLLAIGALNQIFLLQGKNLFKAPSVGKISESLFSVI